MTEAGARARRGPTPAMTLALIPALALLIGLGGWQLHRLEWKTRLLADLEARLAAPALSLSDAVQRADAGEDLRFFSVSFTGQAVTARTARLVAVREGTPGYRFITALTEVGDPGGVVLVDRGFAPSLMTGPPPAPPAWGAQDGVTIDAIVRAQTGRAWFAPPADTDLGVFYTFDKDDIAAWLGVEADRLAAFTLAATAETPPPGQALTAVIPTLDAISNRHFGYALTWFGLAVGLVVIYAAYQRQVAVGRRKGLPAGDA